MVHKRATYARTPRTWSRVLDAVAVAADVTLTTVLVLVVGVYYAVLGETVHHELIAASRPNAALWWAVAWGAGGLAAVVWWLRGLQGRWSQ